MKHHLFNNSLMSYFIFFLRFVIKNYKVFVVRNFKGHNITIEFMFAGINMFWARLRLRLRLILDFISKMSLRRAQNIFMPKNINSITINITLEGIEEIKTEKNDNRTV